MERCWWKEAVVYQVYPRSFQDSSGDGIGDIPGIISRLDYIKSLGVDVIWLNPVYQSPNDDNGYDISGYQAIMEEFGTMADWDRLLEEMHRRGLKLIMDLVVNHTSDEHPWFAEARRNPDSPCRDYYLWRDKPNNWVSYFGGPAWSWDGEAGQYYLHLFSRKQPDLNWENPALREEIYAMMRWWLDKGIDGFRMDVINFIAKDPALPDVPGVPEGELGYGARYYANRPRLHDHLREMNRKVLSRYDAMSVGECGETNLEEALKLVGKDRGELDMIFQMELVSIDSGWHGKWNPGPWTVPQFKEIVDRWNRGLEGRGWNSFFLMNHDQPRALSRFGNDGEYRVPSQKLLHTLILTQPGTPYLYQGEELGMTNVPFDRIEDYRDIDTLNYYREAVEEGDADPAEVMKAIRVKSRDNSRTPMPWSAAPGAGFTDGSPWIPLNPNYRQINVEAAEADPDSPLHYYRRMVRLRRENPVLVYGTWELLLPEHEQLFAYRRRASEPAAAAEVNQAPEAPEGGALVILNFSDRPAVLPETLEQESAEEGGELLIGNYPDPPPGPKFPAGLTLRPWEALVYRMEGRV